MTYGINNQNNLGTFSTVGYWTTLSNVQGQGGALQNNVLVPQNDVVEISGQNANKNKNKTGNALKLGAALAVTLASVTAVLYSAAKRGKAVNEFKGVGENQKLWSNIKEGFKTFAGKGREFYNTNIKNKTPDIPITKEPEVSVSEGGERLKNEAEELAEEIRKNTEALNKVELSTSSEDWYHKTPVCLDETSKEADMQKWVEKFKNAPSEVEINKEDKKVLLNNPVNIEELSKVKPHSYNETSEIFINTRAHNTGFPEGGFGIADGELGELNKGSLLGYIDENLSKDTVGERNYGYYAGISKDGRACVALHFKEKRQDCASRPSHTTILLRSKDANFTQDQLDAIKMFQNLDKKTIMSSGDNLCPLGAAFMLENAGSKTHSPLYFNRNMFFSLIQDGANKADKAGNFNPAETLAANNNCAKRILSY